MRRKIGIFLTSLLFIFSIFGFTFKFQSLAATYIEGEGGAILVPEIYILDLKLNKTEFSQGETVTGSFKIQSGENKVVSDLIYSVSLVSKEPIEQQFGSSTIKKIVRVDEQRNTEKFIIYPNETIEKNFTYKLPPNLAGEYRLEVVIYQGTGDLVAFRGVDIKIQGESNFVLLRDEVVLKGDQELVAEAGMHFSPEELNRYSPKAKFVAENKTNKKIVAIPQVSIYKREAVSTKLSEFQGKEIKLNPGETKTIVLDLPLLKEPNVYVAEIYLLDQQKNKISNSIYPRWIVAGLNAEVLSVTTDKPSYKKGEEINLEVSFIGPAHCHEEKIDADLVVKIFNEKDQIVGSLTQKIDLSSKSKHQLPLKLTAQNNAKGIKIQAQIIRDGKGLANYETALTKNYDALKAKAKKAKNVRFAIILTTILILIILFLGVMKKFYKKPKKTKTISLFILIIFGFLFSGLVNYVKSADNCGDLICQRCSVVHKYAYAYWRPGPDGRCETEDDCYPPQGGDYICDCNCTQGSDESWNPQCVAMCTASISASPNYCQVPDGSFYQCCYSPNTPTIKWSTSGVSSAAVTVKNRAGNTGEELFATGVSGSKQVDWMCYYYPATFYLKTPDENGEVLAQTEVKVYPTSNPGTYNDLTLNWPDIGESCDLSGTLYAGKEYCTEFSFRIPECGNLAGGPPTYQLWLADNNGNKITDLTSGTISESSYGWNSGLAYFTLPSYLNTGYYRLYLYVKAGHMASGWAGIIVYHWHDVTAYKVIYVKTDNPPSATNLKVTSPDYCKLGPGATIFSWTFTDPDGDSQSAYQVQIDNNSNFSSPEVDSGKINSSSNSYSPQTGLNYNTTYYWRVKVWDSEGNESSWSYGPSFTTPKHAYPTPAFTFSPEKPHPRQVVQFTDKSQAFGGAKIKSWSWTFEDGNPPQSTQQNPTTTFLSSGEKKVTLSVTDSDGFGLCSTSTIINLKKPLPRWELLFNPSLWFKKLFASLRELFY
jgi:PKD repeat protein